MVRNHICAVLVLHVSIIGSSGQLLSASRGTNQKLSLIKKAPGFHKKKKSYTFIDKSKVAVRTAKLDEPESLKVKEILPECIVRHDCSMCDHHL